jgi:ATP-dependent exoDNAse (exonuclease V) beta subunit
VIVVEPAAMDLRELYVALTRPTRTLVVVHARELPAALRH